MKEWTTLRFVIAVAITSSVIAATPAIAERVVQFARNADKVDGFHAVGQTNRKDRAGKLVAANSEGRLPNNIIAQARDSRRLDGFAPNHYEDTQCEVGEVVAWAFVPADIGPTLTTVEGVAYQTAEGGPTSAPPSCMAVEVQARRVAVGTYQVDFTPFGIISCPDIDIWATVVSVKNQNGSMLLSNTETICDERGQLVEEVRIEDVEGVRQDASFTIALLTELRPIPRP